MPIVSNNRRGFTLFELLLVVILIGVIYAIFVHKLSQKKVHDESGAFTLETLKTSLSSFPAKRRVELFCFTPCDICNVYRDGKKVEDLDIELFETLPNVYNRDAYGQVQRIEFLSMEDKKEIKDVCFHFTLFSNQSSSSYIVEYDKKFYLFDAYMQPVRVFENLSDASEAFDESILLPTEQRSYNF